VYDLVLGRDEAVCEVGIKPDTDYGAIISYGPRSSCNGTRVRQQLLDRDP
jgi:hypothetical protein